ncbi:hypothetical protein Ate01nite_40400 [Actinoplanes teichomyceticus]|nr:hypothetical protein Ate01nite_40400 [Actinoplanes teichomyceticus]
MRRAPALSFLLVTAFAGHARARPDRADHAGPAGAATTDTSAAAFWSVLLGAVDVRLPFLAAAALSFANAGYGRFVLPESRPGDRTTALTLRATNPVTRPPRSCGGRSPCCWRPGCPARPAPRQPGPGSPARSARASRAGCRARADRDRDVASTPGPEPSAPGPRPPAPGSRLPAMTVPRARE